MPKKMRNWSKNPRPLTPAVVSEQPEKRARIPAPASVESDGNLETYAELNAVELDLHEPDPETMWSSDLGWVPKSILQEAREKEVTKLQQFETYEEVPQDEAEGQELSVHDLSTNGKKVENCPRGSRGNDAGIGL